MQKIDFRLLLNGNTPGEYKFIHNYYIAKIIFFLVLNLILELFQTESTFLKKKS